MHYRMIMRLCTRDVPPCGTLIKCDSSQALAHLGVGIVRVAAWTILTIGWTLDMIVQTVCSGDLLVAGGVFSDVVSDEPTLVSAGRRR